MSRRERGLLRRVGALWIDALAVYGPALGIIQIAEWAGARLALEPVFVALWAVYGATLLAMRGQTIGKQLMGLRVVAADGATLDRRRAIGREIVGKWGLQVVAPIMILRAVVGQGWVPTVYDLLSLVPLSIVIAIYTAMRGSLHDRLARTKVIRSADRDREGTVVLALMVAAAIGLAVEIGAYMTRGFVPSKLALYHRTGRLAPYSTFLASQHVSPVDYVLGLFDRYDVVVVCERMHAESTQWELLFRVISDPRFVDRVGHVFTEYGQLDEQPYLDRFMATDGLDDTQREERVLHLMRNLSVWPTWIRTNFYRYLQRLYSLNQTLPPERRIQHYFSELPIAWEEMTDASYRSFAIGLRERDRKMADRVIEKTREIQAAGGHRKKALVVMNYRHAFGAVLDPDGRLADNVAAYVFEAFPGRVANVFINGFIPMVNAPVAGGLWDAAFEATGNQPRGFDLAGSPFGADPFDLSPIPFWYRGRYRYQDIFTGFVFLNPLADHYLEDGIPGYFDGFDGEARRRAAFLGREYAEVQADEIAHFQNHAFERTPLPVFATQTALAWLQLGALGAALPLALALWLARLRPTPA